MERKITYLLPTLALVLMAQGCIKERATYDTSMSTGLSNITVVDERKKLDAVITKEYAPNRQYLSHKSLGPTFLEILKSHLALHDKNTQKGTKVHVENIEVSVIAVDNSMGGNSTDPGAGYHPRAVFLPSVGVISLNLGPSSNMSLTSVRVVIQYRTGSDSEVITEYGMSKSNKIEPEIQEVFYRAVDQVAKKL